MTDAPPFTDRIPGWLAEMSGVVAVRLAGDGTLREANEGFLDLAPAETREGDAVDDLFQAPRFEDLEEPPPRKAWTLVHEGLINLGPPSAEATTLEGRIWRRDDQLVLLGEHDIEAQRRLNAEVIDLNRELSDVQRELTRELRRRERAEAELEEKMEALERSNDALETFARSISHDLKEPLRTVSGFLKLLEDEHGEDLDDEGRELVAETVEASNRMIAMVEALLGYSRLETAGREAVPVDTREALESALDNLAAALEEADAEVDVGELPTVRADASQLTQLFQNLVSNAVKYRGDEPPRVEVTAEREEGMWRVRVRDHGVGIPDDELESVFQVFERGSSAGQTEGTGVGLALCRRIVETHDGTIDVESEVGEGTTFSFTLPAADPQEPGPDEDG